MCDRTSEFLKYADTRKGSSAIVVKKRLGEAPKTATAFHDAASEIAKGVHSTSEALNKLTKLVRRQGLFDDPSEEINKLIFSIKQNLDELNQKCDTAQQFVDVRKQGSGDKNQLASHNGKVVSQLKTDLMHTTKGFKTVLETRASKMKETQLRKEVLTGNATLSPMRQFSASQAQSAQKNNNSQKQFPSLMDGKNEGMSPMPLTPSPYSNMSSSTDYSSDSQGGNNYMQVRS